MLLGISLHSVAQVRVTGYIFAEVVELTGAEKNTQDHVSLSANEQVSEFAIGEITFRGKANATFEVVISSSSLTGESGTEAFFETRQADESRILGQDGSQTIKLTGNTREDLYSSHDKQFAGNYNVILAYN